MCPSVRRSFIDPYHVRGVYSDTETYVSGDYAYTLESSVRKWKRFDGTSWYNVGDLAHINYLNLVELAKEGGTVTGVSSVNGKTGDVTGIMEVSDLQTVFENPYSGVWSSSTSYLQGQVVKKTVASVGLYFKALQDSVGKDPTSQTAYWSPFTATDQYKYFVDSVTNRVSGMMKQAFSSLVPAESSLEEVINALQSLY